MCLTHISLESKQTLHHIDLALFRRLQGTRASLLPICFLGEKHEQITPILPFSAACREHARYSPFFFCLFHIFQKYEQITPILSFCTACREHVSYSPEKNPKG